MLYRYICSFKNYSASAFCTCISANSMKNTMLIQRKIPCQFNEKYHANSIKNTMLIQWKIPC